MRYLTLLFSFYLAMLTLIPCGDKIDASIKEYASTFHQQKSVNENCSFEGCPPSCACTCCSVSRHFIANPTKSFVVDIQLPSYGEYPIQEIKKQSIAIWQPPKLS